MAFTVVLDPRAIEDIQQAIDYYEKQQPGLGEEFEDILNEYLRKLEQNPFFQIRYDHVHCLPLKKYPYMIHFTVDEEDECVIVRAVFNTSRDPGMWKKRT